MPEELGAGLSERDLGMTNAESPTPHFEVEENKKERKQVGLLLADRRDDYIDDKPHGRTKILSDLKELITAKIDDTNPPAGEKPDDKTKSDLTRLSNVHKTVVNMLANEQIDESLMLEVKNFILEEAGEDEKNGGRNQDTFGAFWGMIPRQFKTDEEIHLFEKPTIEEQAPTAKDHTATDAETNPHVELVTDEEMEALNRELPKFTEVPPQQYKPEKATKALDALKAKKEVTFEDVERFMKAVDDDIPEHGEKLIGAVHSAQEFLKEHGTEGKQRKIVVTVTADGKFEPSWQPRFFKKRQHDGSQYVFDPKGDINNPRSLDGQDLEAGRIEKWHADMELVSSAIEKIKAKEKVTNEEKFAIFRQIERYSKMEATKNERKIDIEKMRYLNKMATFLKNEIEPPTRATMELAA